MFKYARFTAMAFLYSPIIIILLLHGSSLALFLPLTVIVLQVSLDNLLPKYTPRQTYAHAWFLDALVFIQVPLSYLALLVLLWQIAPGDLFGIGQGIESVTGLKILESHYQFSLKDGLLSALACGFYFSVNTLIGHELTHRLTSPFSMFWGRLSLALVGDAQFAISHVHAHHKNVATPEDAATARRGENLYQFFIRSAAGQYRESWEFESKRLARLGRSAWSLRNEVISGLMLTGLIALMFLVLAGWQGLLCYAVFVVTAKFLFESVNYIEHYGLVRVPGQKVEPRHSWDCQNSLSTFNYLNLTRHSDHHANANKPYWELESKDDAMDLPYGYMAFILLATVPPLWHQIMTPRLLAWDRDIATPEERALAQKANQASGISALMQNGIYTSGTTVEEV